MEQEKAVASCANALTALRRHLNRPPSLFDRHEAIELLESLARLARTQAHDKAEEYSAALDEVKARQASLESGHLKRLMLGLVGDLLRAKMAKEATSKRQLCFLLCFSFFLWVGSFSPSPLTSGGPPQCLNSGPGSEPVVNKGLGSLF